MIRRGDFLTKVEKKKFLEMPSKHSKVFAFTSKKISYVDPIIIAPMVIFTISYMS